MIRYGKVNPRAPWADQFRKQPLTEAQAAAEAPMRARMPEPDKLREEVARVNMGRWKEAEDEWLAAHMSMPAAAAAEALNRTEIAVQRRRFKLRREARERAMADPAAFIEANPRLAHDVQATTGKEERMKEQPALEVVEMSVAELVPYANNAKEHSARQVDAIAASIAEFGNCDPVAVWHNAKGEPEIVEGHGRVMALKKLGIDAVPVITLDHLTDAQRRAYTHVHNQTTLNSGFDMDVLDAELEELAAELDVDFEDFGFEEGFDAIGDMLAGEEFCSNSIEGAGVGDVGITFVFPEEHAETVKAYVNDVGKDEIAARIVREAQAWG